jgi:hypothetical protein
MNQLDFERFVLVSGRQSSAKFIIMPTPLPSAMQLISRFCLVSIIIVIFDLLLLLETVI